MRTLVDWDHVRDDLPDGWEDWAELADTSYGYSASIRVSAGIVKGGGKTRAEALENLREEILLRLKFRT